jgi:CheY-like chemotaxis protein
MSRNSGNRKPTRILVADDDQTIALTLSAILEEQGYEVATAVNGYWHGG